MNKYRLGAALSVSLIGALVACGSEGIPDLNVDSIVADGGADATKPDGGGAIAQDGAPPPDGSNTPADAAPEPEKTYAVGGTVSGLSGTGLVLQNNGGDDLAIASNGSFVFTTKLKSKATFAVTIKTQPTAPSQTCVVTGGTGAIVAGNINTVTINCDTNKYTIGGSVSGLAGTGLVLQNNAGDDLVVNSNGDVAFPTTIASGGAYAVTVKTQPSDPSQTCTVENGSGNVANADISSFTVNCVTNAYKVGGQVTGLAGSGLTLQLGAETYPVAGDGSFTFPTSIASGATYAVTVAAQPNGPSQTCVVTGGSGTVVAADVTSVLVNCTTNKYAISGTVSGLTGTGLVLQNNAGDNVPVGANGSFSFLTPVASGASFNVTVQSQPSGPTQTCVVTNGSGTVDNANIESVAVTCTTNKYSVKATVSGLTGTGLVLQNNAGDDITVGANGEFTFPTQIESGKTFTVTTSAQPSSPWQTCTVTDGTGTIGGADVTNVTVTCATNTYTIGGTVSGKLGSGLVLQNNAGDDITVNANGSFTFPTPIASGATYAVTVKTSPSSPTQTCSVSSATGTVQGGNVVTVAVNCTTNTYTIGGTVSGLTGSGLVLQNNGGNDLTVNGNGSFTFGTPIASGGTYSVTVKTQPTVPAQTCTVTSGGGTVQAGNIVDIAIACTTNTYTIGGTVSGLTGSGLVLQNNGGNDLTVNGNGSFTFGTPIASGGTYSVTVKTQPTTPAQTCTVTNGSGSVNASNVTNVSVSCVNNATYKWVLKEATPCNAWCEPTNPSYPSFTCLAGPNGGTGTATCDAAHSGGYMWMYSGSSVTPNNPQVNNNYAWVSRYCGPSGCVSAPYVNAYGSSSCNSGYSSGYSVWQCVLQ